MKPMSNILERFYFENIFVSPDDYIATVSTGLHEKDQLMSCLSAELQFPNYFSSNWDSLEECISDLEWINCPIVWLKHEDIPLMNDGEFSRTYLDILCVASKRLSDTKEKQLRLVFPFLYRDKVENLLLK